MGHGKETPRQKMIGMMYLVLTAMLALNVSKEVLDAFVLVDNGLNVTTEAFAAKNETQYDRFAFLNADNEAKVGEWMDRANELKRRTDEIYDYIQQCKIDIISLKDADAIHDGHIDWHHVKVKDNLETGATVMITLEDGRRYKELKQMLDETREYMLSIIEDTAKYSSTVSAIEHNLSTKPPDKISHKTGKAAEREQASMTWQSGYFETMPLAAVITLLSKMQADVRNVEAEMLNYLLSQVDAGSIPVNALEAVVLAEKSLVFPGQEYTAKVMLAAYDSTKMPVVTLNDGKQLPVEQGKGIYSVTSNTVGIRSWGGTITLEHEGVVYSEPFSATYEVGQATATVSATKMNVFYRGISNPVAISAGSVAESSVVAQITSPHSIKRTGPGEYVVKPGTTGDLATISVYSDEGGKRTLMTRSDFRVEDLPTPTAKITGSRAGQANLTTGALSRLQIVEAEAENFLFEVPFTVTEFNVVATGSGGISAKYESKSENFTREQLTIFRNLRIGQSFTIEDIKAIGPDGKVRQLNPIIVKVI
jgi:gliding motility-associated protein GldM